MRQITKIPTYIQSKIHNRGLDDPRLLGLIVLGIISVAVVWNGVRVVQQNYDLLQKIAVLEEENRVIEIENENKRIQNVYFASAEFAELKARRVNGKAAAGERVYVVTDAAAQNNLKSASQTASTKEAAEDINATQKPSYQRNFEAWMDFFFGG